MARHNKDGKGKDQRDHEYDISYPPDWLQQIKVSRNLGNGRRSTKTLFRNPAPNAEQTAGSKVRTRVTCVAQSIDFSIEIHDPDGIVKRVVVETRAPKTKRLTRGGDGDGEQDPIEFVLEDQMPPPPPPPPPPGGGG